MKILLTSDHHPGSINGVIVSVMNLKMELEKKGEDVRLLTLSPTKESYIEDKVYYIGSLPFNIYPDIRATFRSNHPLVKELIDWKPDIIHSQCEFFTYTFVKRIAAKCHIPIIHTYHTMYEHYMRYIMPIGDGSGLVAPIMRSRLKTADVIIAPTGKVRDSLAKGRVADNIRVIPTGIDLRKFDRRISEERRAEILSSLNIPRTARVFGSVGRLAEEKNYSEVLQVMKSLTESRPDLYLVLTGDGAFKEGLEKETEKLGLTDRVRFPGMIPADLIYEYYQILEFFVSASVSETQGLTYIEALSNGLPVIARRDGAIDRVVISGENGFQYDQPEELKTRIEKLLDSPELKAKLEEGAMASRQQFGTEIFGDRVHNLYKEVLNRDVRPKHERTALTHKLAESIRKRTADSDIGTAFDSIQSKRSRWAFEKNRQDQNKPAE